MYIYIWIYNLYIYIINIYIYMWIIWGNMGNTIP